MNTENIELRMYGMTIYQLSGMQGGIQFGHAKDEYERIYGTDSLYQEWRDKWKTYIVLNGGTTNDNKEKLGTLQLYEKLLGNLGVKYATFREPDLNDSMLAIAFLIDERVFNREKYPDPSWMKDLRINMLQSTDVDFSNYQYPLSATIDDVIDIARVEAIGGMKNLLLRYLLSGMRWAS